jgi:hypothetical protein
MKTSGLSEECTCPGCGAALHRLSRAASRILVAWCPICHRVEAWRRA